MAAAEGAKRILRGSVMAWWGLLLALVVAFVLAALMGGAAMGDTLIIFFGAAALWIGGVWWLVIEPLLKLVKEQRLGLCALRQDLTRLDRFRGEVLATLSHALRTPAATIVDTCEHLGRALDSGGEKMEIQSSLLKSAERIVQVAEDLIEANFAQNNEILVIKEEVDLKKLFGPLIEMFRERASEKGLEFKFTSKGSLPERVKTDPRRLRQILLHLVDNAVRCTDVGWIEMEISVDERGGARDLVVNITDTGRGVSAEERAELFLPFSHGERGLTRKHNGLGLGLYLARSVAQKMGGDVLLVESRPGRGSRFSVWIGADVLDMASRESGRTEGVADLGEMRILVVDDSVENALLVRKQLESVGAEVVAAHGGEEAIALATQSDYQMILLDLQMPGMDGFQVLRKLRSLRIPTPVVALTAHGMESEVQRTRRSGFDGHLVKPLQRSDLFKAVKQIVDRRSHPASGMSPAQSLSL